MTARDDLTSSLFYGTLARDSAGQIENLLDAYRAEVLREAVAKLTLNMGQRKMEHESEYISRFVDGYYSAVDMIDPDKP